MVGYTSLEEVVEAYQHGADVVFVYGGRTIMLGADQDDQGRFVPAVQEKIGDH